MKRSFVAACILLMLIGCGKKDAELKETLRFRDKLLNGTGCTFNAEITANYGDEIHRFSMEATSQANGDLSFTVTQPEVISGISGSVTQSEAVLTFDDTILAFPMLAEGQIAPAAAPWILVKSLRSGYISSVGEDGDYVRVTLLDSFEDNALTLDVWFDKEWTPFHGEILYKGEKILTLRLENFMIV